MHSSAWPLAPLCARHATRSQTHQVLLGFLFLCVLGMPPAHKHIQASSLIRHATRSQTHQVLNTSSFAWLLVPLCARHAARSQTHPVLLGPLCFSALGMPPAHKHIQFCLASCAFALGMPPAHKHIQFCLASCAFAR